MASNTPDAVHPDLQQLARESMRAHGFDPDFPPAVAAELAGLAAHPPAVGPSAAVRDMRARLWSSIDNDTSRDLDQVEVAEALPNGDVRVLVAIADVDTFVPAHSPIDDHAAAATTTVYAGVAMFAMLPEALSTGVTSLLDGADRLAMVIEAVVGSDGAVKSGDVYRAVIQNHAQLTYNAVGAWLEGRGAAPAKVAASADLAAQLRLQDKTAQALKTARFARGALNIETIEVQPVVVNGQVTNVAAMIKSRATELIEDFMIAANEVVARFLDAKHRTSIRRVVKTPARWPRIVDLAASHGTHLPETADSAALNAFLTAQKAADPDHFADLSLAVVKLLGPGEYVTERPGDPAPGHFGLAVEAYTHSTAPNRRFADLATQRILKAAIGGARPPYTDDDLSVIARTCTLKEDDARKVEREMTKRIAALAMSHRIGEIFDALVTGVTPHGTFVRIVNPHVEGLLQRGADGLDVGDRLRVRLVHTDVRQGYLDFVRV